MKNYLNNLVIIPALGLALTSASLYAQEAGHEKPALFVSLRYFNKDNKIPYLIINAKSKIEGKFQPVKNTIVNVYIDSINDEKNIIGKFITDEQGSAKAILPPGMKAVWNTSEKHSFIAVSEADKQYDKAEDAINIVKSKMAIDTISDDETKSVVITVSVLENGQWIPVEDVEVKAGVQRFGGILPVNDEVSFTTDANGQATADFARLELPGNEKGDLMIVAQVEDNEMIGNISTFMNVPWGTKAVHEKKFFKRALWGTNRRTPVWLLFIAYSIIASVWGVLVYLVFQLIRISRIGKSPAEE